MHSSRIRRSRARREHANQLQGNRNATVQHSELCACRRARASAQATCLKSHSKLSAHQRHAASCSLSWSPPGSPSMCVTQAARCRLKRLYCGPARLHSSVNACAPSPQCSAPAPPPRTARREFNAGYNTCRLPGGAPQASPPLPPAPLRCLHKRPRHAEVPPQKLGAIEVLDRSLCLLSRLELHERIPLHTAASIVAVAAAILRRCTSCPL